MKNLNELKKEYFADVEKKGKRYLNSIDFEATKTLNKIVNELKNAELIGASFIQAIKRDEQEIKIDFTPNTYISYILNDYIVYLEFGHFWIFEGVHISAYPIKDNEYYQTNKYPMYKIINNDDDLMELINILKDPKVINETMENIPQRKKDDKEYCNRKRKIEKRFYIF